MKNVGIMVIWSLYLGGDGVLRSDLEEKFRAAGLRVPSPPEASTRLTRAVQRLQTGRPWLGTKRIDNGVGFVTHDVDATGKRFNPEHAFTARVEADVVTGAPALSFRFHVQPSPALAELRRDLERAFDDAAKFALAVDLRGILQASIAGSGRRTGMGGVPVVGNGVQAYFVPAQFAEQAKELGRIVTALSPASRFDVFELGDSVENLASLQRCARASALDDLREVRAQVAEIRESGKVNEKSFSAKMETYQLLRDKVELWRGVLGDIVDELVTGIEEARDSLRSDLGLPAEGVRRGETVDGVAITRTHNILAELVDAPMTLDAIREAYFAARNDTLSEEWGRRVLQELVKVGRLARSGDRYLPVAA